MKREARESKHLAIIALTGILLIQITIAQQPGIYTPKDENPTITLKECTIAGGCTSRQAKLTLDANWRWIHSKSGPSNCYTGNQWSSQLCSDPSECAENCVVEGVSRDEYSSVYGIEQVPDGVRLNYLTSHNKYGTNVGSRLYVMDEDGDNYELFRLKNREFSFDVDVSQLQCGQNGAAYFSEMQANGGLGIGNNAAGATFGTGYCDSQCPHDIKFIDGEANIIDWKPNANDINRKLGAGKYGACCTEMDIWDANSMATAYTPHTCGEPGLYRCEGIDCGDNDEGKRYDGVCDKDGCDINPYRTGNPKFYGRGPEFEVNTLEPMKVVTQFFTSDGTDDGDLVAISRLYIQNGKIIYSPSTKILGPDNTDSITDNFCDAQKSLFGDVKDYQEHGGMTSMGESLDRGHVMIFSLSDNVEDNMLWLDSAYPLDKPVTDPGIKRGECPGGETSTPTWLSQKHPDAYVIFKNAAVGEIGSTFDINNPTNIRPPQPTPNPPSDVPSISPSISPTVDSTKNPSINPTISPSFSPSISPTKSPFISPSVIPTDSPSVIPSTIPSFIPTNNPSINPINSPSVSPTIIPSTNPTVCVEGSNDIFFYKMREANPLYRDCKWLRDQSKKRRNRVCSKTESYGDVGPAQEVCKYLCDTCHLTLDPTSSPANEPSSEPPTMNPTRKLSSISPTLFATQNPTKAPSLYTRCCSQDFKTCANSGLWCHHSQKNCEECKGIMIFNAPLKCIERYGECTHNANDCCAPATCQGNSRYYRQCLS